MISSAIEHPAILVYLKDLEGRGEIALDCVPVNAHGVISVADVVARLQKYTALVTIMHSNNEIGTIQPIAEIAGAVKASQFGNGVLVHTDAAQSIGR